MNTGRFTMILEYRGGSYFSQIEASDEHDAIRQWAAAFRLRRALGRMTGFVARAVERALESPDGPAAMEGLVGCWCHSALCGGDLVLLTIIESAAQADPPRCD